MHHVKLDGDQLWICLGLGNLESGFFRLAIHRHKVVEEVAGGIVFGDVLLQRGDIVFDTEEDTASIHELDINVFQPSIPEPCIPRQIHCLLRRTRAFDGHWRLGKDRATFFQLLHQLPRVGRKVVAIVRSYAIAAQSVFESFDRAPIQLKTGANDQAVIFHNAAAIEDDNVIFRLERGDG